MFLPIYFFRSSPKREGNMSVLHTHTIASCFYVKQEEITYYLLELVGF